MTAALLDPWRRPRTWWSLVHTLLDLVAGYVTGVVVAVLLVVAIAAIPTVVLVPPMAWLLFVVARGLGRMERSRAAALLGVAVPAPTSALRGSWLSRLWQRARSASRWREIGYLLLLLPLGVVTFSLAVVAWSGSVVLVLLPAYVAALPHRRADFGVFVVHPGAGSLLAGLIGLFGLVLAAPWLTVALGALDGMVVRKLLGPSRDQALTERVQTLEASRVAAVDSAESERRRIERDLHDGAQQRLVALAMDLGQARERMADDPAGATKLVEGAHEEAKAALAELRELVRGIHPAILGDRGLDAALSAVVARSAVPVTLSVDLPERPPAAVESAAYFIVSECLANVGKHAHATSANVTIARQGASLIVEVRDDGLGGADPAAGTGLHGLADRVAALDGWMRVISPAGGPTTVFAVLPCAS